MNSQQGTNYRINIDTNGNVVLPTLAANADKADASLVKFTKDANGRLRDANGRFLKTKQTTDQLGASVHGLGSKAETGLGRMERKALSSGKAIGRLKGLVAGLGLTLSTGMLAAGLVGTGAGFEKSMSNVQALAGATQTEMVSLKQAARDAGATTAFSAKQSADAMGYLAQAGYNANQQIEALPATLNLAASGGLGLARSADIATNILSQYRMQASQTGVVVDQLAFTQSSFNTNVEEMADAMNYWGPSAKAMKIGLSESNAVIGLLANNGLKGSLATRALGTSIVKLNKPTTQMQKTIESLNLNLHDSEGQFVGVANMVEQLNRQTAGLNDKQKQAAISTIFGNEAIQEMNILMAEGADKIRYWTGELDNADGAAKRMADTKLDNLAGDFQILQSTVQETSLQLYDNVGPALRLVTQEATLFVRSLDTKQVGLTLRTTILQVRKGIVWLKENRKTIVALGKGIIVLKAATLAYSTAGNIQAGVLGITKAATLAHSMVTGQATVATIAFNTAIKANPLGLMLGALTAVIAAVTLFKSKTNEATEAQSRLNEKRLEWKNIGKNVDEFARDTSKAQARLNDGKLNPRQLATLFRDAETRNEDLEDKLSSLTFDRESFEKVRDARQRKVDALKGTRLGGGRFRTKFSYINAQGEKVTENTSHYHKKMWNGKTDFTQLNDKGRQLYFAPNSLNKEIASISSKENNARAILENNKALIKQLKPLLPKDESSGLLGKPVNTVVDREKTSENIISGGASQRIINIKIDKFQDNVNFNIQGQINELRDNMDEMREMFNETLLRVVNSANQMANG